MDESGHLALDTGVSTLAIMNVIIGRGEKRKQLSDSLLWANGIDPSEGLEDDDLLQALIDELLTLVDGYLAPFAPVMANILKNWMTA